MSFLQRLFRRDKRPPSPAAARAPVVPPPDDKARTGQADGQDTDARILALWDEIQALKWKSSEEALRQRVELCSTLLGFIDQGQKAYDKGAILRTRAMTYARLDEYDLALADLQRELALTSDPALAQDCRNQIERIEREKAEAGTDEKALLLRDMESHLGGGSESGFDQVFAYLSHEDPQLRAKASEVFGYHRDALQRLASIYENDVATDPRRAVLAGRVLGRKMSQGSAGPVISERSSMMRLGVPLTFVTCNCIHCSHPNVGIPCPAGGVYDFGSESTDEGWAYSLPVLCDSCGKEFTMAWSYDPR